MFEEDLSNHTEASLENIVESRFQEAIENYTEGNLSINIFSKEEVQSLFDKLNEKDISKNWTEKWSYVEEMVEERYSVILSELAKIFSEEELKSSVECICGKADPRVQSNKIGFLPNLYTVELNEMAGKMFLQNYVPERVENVSLEVDLQNRLKDAIRDHKGGNLVIDLFSIQEVNANVKLAKKNACQSPFNFSVDMRIRAEEKFYGMSTIIRDMVSGASGWYTFFSDEPDKRVNHRPYPNRYRMGLDEKTTRSLMDPVSPVQSCSSLRTSSK